MAESVEHLSVHYRLRVPHARAVELVGREVKEPDEDFYDDEWYDELCAAVHDALPDLLRDCVQEEPEVSAE